MTLYDFTFREHSPSQGRWISPDPAGTAAVDPTNPQSWNRYAYVLNNPLSYVDPLGLKPTYCPMVVVVDNCNGGAGGDDQNGGDVDGVWMDSSLVYGALQGGFGFIFPSNAVLVDGGCFGCTYVQEGSLSNCLFVLANPCGGTPQPGPANNGVKPPNPITAVQSDGQKEAACEHQAQAAFGSFATPQSARSTVFGGIIGWILGKTPGAIGLGITVSQVSNFDSKAMDYNATLQACRQASGIGGLAQAVQVTP